MKVAFSGTSGSGKTTLAKWVAEKLNIPHISGSAGDLYTKQDRDFLRNTYLYETGKGHGDVIIASAIDPAFGATNQRIILQRRIQLIGDNPKFVTDRSPADNIVYYLNQVGFHKEITNDDCRVFLDFVQQAWQMLDYVIYVKAVQPNGVEDNGSRVSNWYYQQSIDAQFEFWIDYLMRYTRRDKPNVLIIDYWDLNRRKEEVLDFLEETDTI